MSSFQTDVKNELYSIDVKSDCCIYCEYSAIRLTSKNKIKTNSALYRDRLKFFVKKVHELDCDIKEANDEYEITFPSFVFEMQTLDDCCMKSFIRGVYITSGRINNADKPTHLEIDFTDDLSHNICLTSLKHFNIDVKTTVRNKKKLIYIKDSEIVSDFLTLIGAHIAVCEFENARIIKELRNNANRAVNCDNANIQKANDAAYRQICAIKKLQQKNMFETLPKHLIETSLLRLENPELNLKELGMLLEPPISRAGASHRLNRIIKLAGDD